MNIFNGDSNLVGRCVDDDILLYPTNDEVLEEKVSGGFLTGKLVSDEEQIGDVKIEVANPIDHNDYMEKYGVNFVEDNNYDLHLNLDEDTYKSQILNSDRNPLTRSIPMGYDIKGDFNQVKMYPNTRQFIPGSPTTL